LLTKLNFKPSTRKPYLYHGTFQGKEVLFLQKMDNFAVAAKDINTAIAVIKEIDKYIMIDTKDLGQLDWYNRVDNIHSHNSTYEISYCDVLHQWRTVELQKVINTISGHFFCSIPIFTHPSLLRELKILVKCDKSDKIRIKTGTPSPNVEAMRKLDKLTELIKLERQERIQLISILKEV
jgi:hypothetical protein